VSFTFVPVQIYNQLILRIGNYTLSENYSSYPLQIMYLYFLYMYALVVTQQQQCTSIVRSFPSFSRNVSSLP